MSRPQIIMIPTQRPRVCAECPLLGRRPDGEVPMGSKYTMRCLLPGHEKDVSGRGSKQEGARFRCKQKEWDKAVVTYAGNIPISPTVVRKYGLSQMEFIFEMRERAMR